MGGKWPLTALFAVSVWGGSFVATKHALGPEDARVFTPFGLVALRFLMGGGAMLVALLVRGGKVLPAPADRGRTLLLGAILGTHIGIQTYGLRFTYATHAGWIVAFGSVTIAVAAHLFLRQRLRAIGWLGVVVAMAGVFGVTRPHTGVTPEHMGFGDFLQFLGCFTWTAYTLLGAKAVRGSGPVRVTTWASLAAGLAMLVPVCFSGFGSAPGLSEILSLLYLGFLSSALAFAAWMHAQAKFGSQRTAAMLYLEPFVTAIVASFVGEPIVLVTVIGGATVLLGVWLVQRGAARVR
jgi:drug/metabolite transporter (DMT)-like permease